MIGQTRLGGSFTFPASSLAVNRMGYGAMQLAGRDGNKLVWGPPKDVDQAITWGWVHELHSRNWSFRYASAAMPRVANGLRFDHRLFRNRGDVFEAEYRYTIRKHGGAIRLLNYENHANAGDYAAAIRKADLSGSIPDVTATRRNGTLKYGFGLNMEQEVAKDIGIFARLGWNDGNTESFAFTAIDRLATVGVSITGQRWRRPFDTAATELTASGISGVHAQYLARGGHDFLIGDGGLRYGHEYITETYYSARVLPGVFVSFDLQHVSNPERGNYRIVKINGGPTGVRDCWNTVR